MTPFQKQVLSAIYKSEPLTGLKGYALAKITLHKKGLITSDGHINSAGLAELGIAPESPKDAPTATKAKAAILPSEKAKKTPKAAAESQKAPAPKEEPKPYEPTEQYLSIMDEKQNRIGFIVEREALFFALNTTGQLVNRGISPASAEKRFRQLTKR